MVKKKALLNMQRDLDEKHILEEVSKNASISKHVENKIIKKSIYIKNKLINLII